MATTKEKEKAPQAEIVEEVQVPEVELCGHINRHSLGLDGKPDNLACTLPKGHTGNHSAEHYEVATQVSGMLEDVQSMEFNQLPDGKMEITTLREWGDMAGIPAKDIVPARPGVELLNADHLFGVESNQRISDLEDKIAKLEKLLAKK